VLNKDIISRAIPHLHLHDTIAQALQLMHDLQQNSLPVIAGDKFAGLIEEDELLEAGDDSLELSTLETAFIRLSVRGNEHFSKALQLVAEQHISLVPVTDEDNEWLGVISAADLLRHTALFLGANEPGGLVVLEVEKRNFSFSEISRLVETHDALITHLNTAADPITGNLLITLKISKTEISDVVATLQRFEYQVRYYQGEEQFENELRNNYENLINYLSI
jgi:acetoin utilization protein AcuB